MSANVPGRWGAAADQSVPALGQKSGTTLNVTEWSLNFNNTDTQIQFYTIVFLFRLFSIYLYMKLDKHHKQYQPKHLRQILDSFTDTVYSSSTLWKLVLTLQRVENFNDGQGQVLRQRYKTLNSLEAGRSFMSLFAFSETQGRRV